jgi:putative ABC transport system substrate-binding protein
MRRREFITLLGSAAAWPLVAGGQQAERIRRIAAIIPPLLLAEGAEALRQGLKKLGWTDGQDIRIDSRRLSGDTAHVRSDVTDVVAQAPEVIVSGGTESTMLLKEKTKTIPIVFVHVADPLSGGLVQSLARPGGNITGFAAYESSIGGKWLEALKEIAPHVQNILILVDRQNPTWRMHVPAIETAAPSFNVQVMATNVSNAQDIESAIETFAGKPNIGVVVLPSLILDSVYLQLLIALAAKHRFPTISANPNWTRGGGLISYSSDWVDLYRRAAEYVDKILKGANAGDLPVQQPIKFELGINLRTARALDLDVPPTLLARADEVIE